MCFFRFIKRWDQRLIKLTLFRYLENISNALLFSSGFFLDIRSKTQGEKNLNSSSKNSKLKNFLLRTQISSKNFRNFRRFLTKNNYFCLTSGKIYQKHKSLPKTQGKISKKPSNFRQNFQKFKKIFNQMGP